MRKFSPQFFCTRNVEGGEISNKMLMCVPSSAQECALYCATPTATTETGGASATPAGRVASAHLGTRSARCRTAADTGGASRESASAQTDSPGSSAKRVRESYITYLL